MSTTMRFDILSAPPTASGLSRTGATSTQVEIDVTPVMNLFMILIPFLVSMAFFSHLAFQSFRLPAGEAEGQAQTAAELPWTVAVTGAGVALTRGEIIVAESPRAAAGYDFDALTGLLAEARVARPGVERVVVAIDDGVVAADLVRALDCVREAGFEQIGVAAGTGLDGAVSTAVVPVVAEEGGRS